MLLTFERNLTQRRKDAEEVSVGSVGADKLGSVDVDDAGANNYSPLRFAVTAISLHQHRRYTFRPSCSAAIWRSRYFCTLPLEVMG